MKVTDTKSLLDQLSEFWLKRSTVKGFAGLFLIINFILISIFALLFFLLNKIEYLDNTESFIKFLFAGILGFGLLNILLVLCWVYWRRVPQINNNHIGILFAPHSDKECKDLVIDLYHQFALDLKKRNLNLPIKPILLPENHSVFNSEEALFKLNYSGARLIIYGKIRDGNINNEPIKGFKEIKFTVRHRPLEEIENDAVIKDLAGSLAYRKFTSSSKNSFIEKDIISENLSEVSCFFVALALTLDGEVQKSQEILEHLLDEVNRKIILKINNNQLKIFSNSIVSCMTVNLHSQFSYIYSKHLVDNISNPRFNSYANECHSILSKLVKLNKKTSDYYLSLAIIHFHFDRIQHAVKAVREAQKLAPLNNPSPLLSLGFLFLWIKDYKKAIKYYLDSAKTSYPGHDVIIDVISFIQGIINQNPERTDLLFGLAFVNDKFYDKFQALTDYNKFIDASTTNAALEELVEYSKMRVNTFKQNPDDTSI